MLVYLHQGELKSRLKSGGYRWANEGRHIQQSVQAATAGTTADIAPEANTEQQLAAALATTLVRAVARDRGLSNITSTMPHTTPQLYTIHCSQQKVSRRFQFDVYCICYSHACYYPNICMQGMPLNSSNLPM
jgi:hypothetical protein